MHLKFPLGAKWDFKIPSEREKQQISIASGLESQLLLVREISQKLCFCCLLYIKYKIVGNKSIFSFISIAFKHIFYFESIVDLFFGPALGRSFFIGPHFLAGNGLVLRLFLVLLGCEVEFLCPVSLNILGSNTCYLFHS
jgi:hypothetical protein